MESNASPDPADVLARTTFALARAAAAGRRARIRYRDVTGALSSRDVSVLGLAWRDEGWLFLAHCSLRAAWVLFRVDRVLAVRVTRKAAVPTDAAFDPRAFAGPAGSLRVTLLLDKRLRPPLGRILFPGGLIEQLPSGESLCHLLVSSFDSAARLTHTLAPYATPAGPPEFVRFFQASHEEHPSPFR